MTIHLRQDRAVFRVSGPDAAKLLHDTLTGHVETGDGGGHWWALLTPQGKIIAEGLLGWADEAFWLDVHVESADQFARMMRLYKLRADMEIENVTESHVVGWCPDAPENGVVHADPRGGGLGYRVIATKEAAPDWSADPAPYTAARIAAGVVEVGADYPSVSQFPHDIGMDFNDGIDFQKGCYIGQEVVSRMKHRGTARRRPVIVSGNSGAPGDAVQIGERGIGEIGAAAGDQAIAVVRIDRVSDPDAASVNGTPVSLALPSWASYRFADSDGD